MNRRRVAALLRALADEIDDAPAPELADKPEPARRDFDDVTRETARRALRRAGLVGSGPTGGRKRHGATT